MPPKRSLSVSFDLTTVKRNLTTTSRASASGSANSSPSTTNTNSSPSAANANSSPYAANTNSSPNAANAPPKCSSMVMLITSASGSGNSNSSPATANPSSSVARTAADARSLCPNDPVHLGMITRNKAHAALDQNIFVRLGFDHLYDDYPLAEKWKEKPRRWTVKELQAPIKAIKEKMKDCICPGGKDLYELACSWRDQEFARADNMEDYISYLNTRYGANKWHEVLRGIRYKGIDPRGNVTSETEITADLRESQRQPNSRMTELGKVMYNPGVKFAFIKHSPRRSFWKAFAHSNPQFGTENSWPVVQWQIRAWMTYIEGLALSPRRRLYAAFEYNIPDTPGDGTLWDEANYSMLYRITRADLPVPLFFAQIVADFYCIEVVVIMPMRDDGVYDAKAIHPIVVRGEPCGRQVILHLDENGEWHSVKPLVRIPRHFRMKVPDAIYDQDVEDIETISTAPLDHLIRCPFVKYPITSQGAEPINSIDATKQYAQLQAFYLDAPFLTQPHFGTVTYEMVQWLRRFDLAVIQDPLRPILLPEDAYQGGDKIPADVREDREAEDVA